MGGGGFSGSLLPSLKDVVGLVCSPPDSPLLNTPPPPKTQQIPKQRAFHPNQCAPLLPAGSGTAGNPTTWATRARTVPPSIPVAAGMTLPVPTPRPGSVSAAASGSPPWATCLPCRSLKNGRKNSKNLAKPSTG